MVLLGVLVIGGVGLLVTMWMVGIVALIGAESY